MNHLYETLWTNYNLGWLFWGGWLGETMVCVVWIRRELLGIYVFANVLNQTDRARVSIRMDALYWNVVWYEVGWPEPNLHYRANTATALVGRWDPSNWDPWQTLVRSASTTTADNRNGFNLNQQRGKHKCGSRVGSTRRHSSWQSFVASFAEFSVLGHICKECIDLDHISHRYH